LDVKRREAFEREVIGGELKFASQRNGRRPKQISITFKPLLPQCEWMEWYG